MEVLIMKIDLNYLKQKIIEGFKLSATAFFFFLGFFAALFGILSYFAGFQAIDTVNVATINNPAKILYRDRYILRNATIPEVTEQIQGCMKNEKILELEFKKAINDTQNAKIELMKAADLFNEVTQSYEKQQKANKNITLSMSYFLMTVVITVLALVFGINGDHQ